MSCQVTPYEGSEPYLFFSYCHQDRARVYPIIERLSLEGFRIWYDSGISAGADWAEVIARHLKDSSACIAAISQKSSESHNCRNEVNFAVANAKPMLSVLLEAFAMPLGMQLQLGTAKYIKMYELAQQDFYQQLLAAPILTACRRAGVQADPLALREWEERARTLERELQPAAADPVSSSAVARDWFGLRQRHEAEAAAEKERLRHEAEAAAEMERLRREAEAAAEKERLRREAEAAAERERLRREAEAAAEKERLRREAEAAAEKERLRHEAEAAAERERLRREAEAAAEKERLRREAEAAAERERLRREAEAAAERERLRREAEAAAERERLRREEHFDSESIEDEYADDEATVCDSPRTFDEDEDDEKTVVVKAKTGLVVRMETGEFFRIDQIETILGRSPASADLAFPDNRAIGRAHAEIIQFRDKYFLQDLGSANGTTLRGKELVTGEKNLLSDYEEFTLADENFLFLSGSMARELLADPVCPALRSTVTGEIRLLIGDELPLDRHHKWKGGVLADKRINRENHAALIPGYDGYAIKDINSTNGTFLNGRRLSHGETVQLKDHDQISVVETGFEYTLLKLRQGEKNL